MIIVDMQSDGLAKFGSDSQLKEAFREKLQDTPWGELKKAP